MGYCMRLNAARFKVVDEAAAAAAIRALPAGGWTRNVPAGAAFADALRAWRWWYDADIATLEFDGEKLGDEQTLWHAIAPYVESGSFIEMVGEDDTTWRWVFKNGQVYEAEGIHIFDAMPHAELIDALDAILQAADAGARQALISQLKARVANGVTAALHE